MLSLSSPLPAVSPHTMDYFYGRITRDEAEKQLRDGHDGLFLLRWCISHANGYAVSVCHHQKVHHYAIECQPDGRVSIAGGKKFAGPVELIDYHRKKKAGMVTKLKTPCVRPPGMSAPYFWFGVTTDEFCEAVSRQDPRASLRDPERVASRLHLEQPWFHGKISRTEAEHRLRDAGLRDGTFLIREKDNEAYALSLCHRGMVWHYAIGVSSTSSGSKMHIDQGPHFENLMDLVTFYHGGGLYCSLTLPCERPNYRSRLTSAIMTDFRRRRERSAGPTQGRLTRAPDLIDDDYINNSKHPQYPQHPQPSAPSFRSASSCESLSTAVHSRNFTALHATPSSTGSTCTVESNAESVYFFVRQTTDNIFDIKRHQLEITGVLGTGQFGSVRKAIYTSNGQQFPVAVKTLKTDVSKESTKKRELMKEAKIMAELDNRHIIRMIGICKAGNMLILEYAELGPLRDYLKQHRETTMKNIMELMRQVAQGMAYLESMNVVHRDLAARNILLVNQHHAKISDFGLSREVTRCGKDYYESLMKKDQKWPIKWYAPECLRTRKFDSKSDVWSYGVTLWEATSYAETPYKDVPPKEYERTVERGGRLSKPLQCPSNVYGLMLHCWAHERDGRPTFQEIVKRFNRMTCMQEDDDDAKKDDKEAEEEEEEEEGDEEEEDDDDDDDAGADNNDNTDDVDEKEYIKKSYYDDGISSAVPVDVVVDEDLHDSAFVKRVA